MIAMLMGLGASQKAAKVIAYVAVPLLIAFALWLALNAYGNARYKAGVIDTDAKWEEASRALEAKSLKAQGVADERADARAQEHAVQVATEKEKLDVAEKNGTSAFDALFPVGG